MKWEFSALHAETGNDNTVEGVSLKMTKQEEAISVGKLPRLNSILFFSAGFKKNLSCGYANMRHRSCHYPAIWV